MFNKRLPPIREFLSNVHEWHSFWVGALEIMCPWPPRINARTAQLGYLEKEYHYYLMGRAVGAAMLVLSLLGVALLVKVWFW